MYQNGNIKFCRYLGKKVVFPQLCNEMISWDIFYMNNTSNFIGYYKICIIKHSFSQA